MLEPTAFFHETRITGGLPLGLLRYEVRIGDLSRSYSLVVVTRTWVPVNLIRRKGGKAQQEGSQIYYPL
jgi:hypothetical protein